MTQAYFHFKSPRQWWPNLKLRQLSLTPFPQGMSELPQAGVRLSLEAGVQVRLQCY